MKRFKVLILLMLFLLLAGYVYFFEIQNDHAPATSQNDRIIRVDPTEIHRIELVTTDQTITFAKEHDEWKLYEPSITGSTINSEKISGLLSVFNYGVIRVVEEDPDDLARYGLAQPAIRFSFEKKDDPKPVSLLIGDTHPTGNSCYAKLESDDRVFLVGILYSRELNKKAADFL